MSVSKHFSRILTALCALILSAGSLLAQNATVAGTGTNFNEIDGFCIPTNFVNRQPIEENDYLLPIPTSSLSGRTRVGNTTCASSLLKPYLKRYGFIFWRPRMLH